MKVQEREKKRKGNRKKKIERTKNSSRRGKQRNKTEREKRKQYPNCKNQT